MTTYAALLRGINVGGHNRLRMADLRTLATELGFGAVATYLQSGNVVLTSDAAETDVARGLEAAIEQRLGFEVPVIVRDLAAMAAVAAARPFGDREIEATKFVVLFLAREPDAARVAALEAWGGPEEIVARGRDIFVHYPNGQGRSKLVADVGVPATARNRRTVEALLAMMREMS